MKSLDSMCIYFMIVGLFVSGIVFLFDMKEEFLLSVKIKEVMELLIQFSGFLEVNISGLK